VLEQIKGRRAGYLLGAGASYLDGRGFPLAAGLWTAIKGSMPLEDQRAIEARMNPAGLSLEATLDLLALGYGGDDTLRKRVIDAIGTVFAPLTPPLEEYSAFIRGLGVRREPRLPVFTLNYDCLTERAADATGSHLIDGFGGVYEASFRASQFLDVIGQYETRRARRVFAPHPGAVILYKLHGSLGWHADDQGRITRMRPELPCPAGFRRLMVPPQHWKAADTGYTPYATLWSEFRAYLANDTPRLLSRLVCAGYGFADGHVNAVIDAALQREHFTLVILARALSDEAFNKYAVNPHVILVTEGRSSLYGEQGAGLAREWSFEWLSGEV
jgi:hypothetical protein